MSSDFSHERQKRDLSLETLRSQGSVRMRALGTSMVQSIWPGDVVSVEKGIEDIKTGTIVLTLRDDRLFMHRLVDVNKSEGDKWFVTQGDALALPDPAVSRDQILGRISSVHRKGRVTILSTELGVSQRLIAWAFCHFKLVRRILLRLHARRVNEQPDTNPAVPGSRISVGKWEGLRS